MTARKKKKPGTMRTLDPDDPRSLDHPSHETAWLELAAALGRAIANEEFDKLHGKGQDHRKGTGQVKRPK